MSFGLARLYCPRRVCCAVRFDMGLTVGRNCYDEIRTLLGKASLISLYETFKFDSEPQSKRLEVL